MLVLITIKVEVFIPCSHKLSLRNKMKTTHRNPESILNINNRNLLSSISKKAHAIREICLMAKSTEKVQLFLVMEFTTQEIGKMIRWQDLVLCIMHQATHSTSESGSITNLMVLDASITKMKNNLKVVLTTKILMNLATNGNLVKDNSSTTWCKGKVS